MQLEQLYPIIKNPLQMTLALERRLPGLSTQVLSVLAEVIEPHLRGVGLKILEYSDDAIKCLIPVRKRNLNSWTNEIQNGTLMSCSEFSMRLLIERYIDRAAGDVIFKECNVKRLAPLKADLLMTTKIDSKTREEFFLKLFSQGTAKTEIETLVFNEKQQIVSQLTTQLLIRSRPQIGG